MHLPSFPDPVDLDDLLHPFQHFGVNLGLSRIQRLLAALGNPHHSIPLIHVAGTNGKGSVCAYITAVLTAAGYRVGCHTSPHLVSWCERITLNQVPISAPALRQVLGQVIAAIDPQEPLPTLFEIMSAATWLYFAQERVDLAVMEVGLGGRLDATNVCDRPLATVITSISRDHWQVLGSTLGEIAREKAGIFKAHCPAFVGVLPPEAAAVVQQQGAAVGCPVTWVEPALRQPSENSSPGLAPVFPPQQTLISQGIAYRISLQGDPQRLNSALALAVIQGLRRRGWAIAAAALAQGMVTAAWPARLQWVAWGDRPLLLDGAHNPGSALALRAYVDDCRSQWGEGLATLPFSPAITGLSSTTRPSQIPALGITGLLSTTRPSQIPALGITGLSSTTRHSQIPSTGVTWIMGMLDTKDHGDIFRALLRSGDRLHLVPVPSHSSADPVALATLATTLCPTLAQVQAHPHIAAALDASRQQPPGLPTVLCGSLYLLGHVLERGLLRSVPEDPEDPENPAVP
ncbi:bifunctional folylpolyglutamate synthase/dihydrofolate synthase [Prochlorothrix hollandica]|uniref:bifunctional folylpolyglutamate synthase/dihydrofolate synthase n=1 Tax=Prochlorothrix hollandica TaxID=1223 RepID=UPI0033412876